MKKSSNNRTIIRRKARAKIFIEFYNIKFNRKLYIQGFLARENFLEFYREKQHLHKGPLMPETWYIE